MEINIKDFILEDKIEEKDKTEKTGKSVKLGQENYETVLVSGPDFIVRKKGRAPVLLVCLFSQGQFYTKKEASGEIEKLTPENLKVFLSKTEQEAGLVVASEDGNFPTSLLDGTLAKGLKACRNFVSVVNHKDFIDAAKKGMAGLWYQESYERYLFPEFLCSEYYYRYDAHDTKAAAETIYKMIKKHYGSKYDNEFRAAMSCFNQGDIKSLSTISGDGYRVAEMFRQYFEFLSVKLYGKDGFRSDETAKESFIRRFGTEIIFEFFDACLNSALKDIRSEYYFPRLLEFLDQNNIVLDKNSFLNYVVNESCVQGYSNDLSGFVCTWRDVLQLQLEVYGEIKCKYPEYLASYEVVLNCKHNQLVEAQNIEGFKQVVENLEKYEYKNGAYSILIPRTVDDVLEEARKQSNCLATYVSRIVEGRSEIFFLRKTDKINDSLVTIEVDGERDNIVQVKRKFNRAPSSKELDFVYTWFNNVYLRKKYEKKEAV